MNEMNVLRKPIDDGDVTVVEVILVSDDGKEYRFHERDRSVENFGQYVFREVTVSDE